MRRVATVRSPFKRQQLQRQRQHAEDRVQKDSPRHTARPELFLYRILYPCRSYRHDPVILSLTTSNTSKPLFLFLTVPGHFSFPRNIARCASIIHWKTCTVLSLKNATKNTRSLGGWQSTSTSRKFLLGFQYHSQCQLFNLLWVYADVILRSCRKHHWGYGSVGRAQ